MPLLTLLDSIMENFILIVQTFFHGKLCNLRTVTCMILSIIAFFVNLITVLGFMLIYPVY